MLNFEGLVVGAFAFLIIGLFHPVVIKTEYYFGTRPWLVFLFVGLACLVISLLVDNSTVSILLGVTAFCLLWSVGELFEQKKRVERGWFPQNPKRKDSKEHRES